jgi:hypothetical protein
MMVLWSHQRTEMEIEIGPELEPTIGMGDGNGAFDVVLYRLDGGVGNVVDRQNQDVITNADPAILSNEALERCFGEVK